MLIPTKHTRFPESLLGFGAYILQLTDKPKTIDSLWNEYQNDILRNSIKIKHSFNNFLLTLVFLHSIGVIEEDEGSIARCN